MTKTVTPTTEGTNLMNWIIETDAVEILRVTWPFWVIVAGIAAVAILERTVWKE